MLDILAGIDFDINHLVNKKKITSAVRRHDNCRTYLFVDTCILRCYIQHQHFIFFIYFNSCYNLKEFCDFENDAEVYHAFNFRAHARKPNLFSLCLKIYISFLKRKRVMLTMLIKTSTSSCVIFLKLLHIHIYIFRIIINS